MPDTVYTQNEIDDWRKECSPRPDILKAHREYVRSDQGRPMTHAQQKMLGRRGKHPVADNVLKLIVRTTAARLELLGFTCEAQPVVDFLDELWMKNRMKAMQYATHFAMLRDGNHAVSLRWKNSDREGIPGRVTLHREPWWDGTEGIFVAYGDYGEPQFAVKEWEEKNGTNTTTRRTVYYPDLMQRLRRVNGNWEPFMLPTDPPDSLGAVPWENRDGYPLGIPVVHFVNNLESDDDYGTSDIAGLLGLQDDLNAIQRDITAASAFTAFQMYLFTGVAAGETVEVAPGYAQILSDAAADGKALPAGDTTNLSGAHGYKRETMAIDTSTPIHIIAGGDWPSGAALLRAETPLVSKVTALQAIVGPAWTTVAHRATEIANTFGNLGLDENALIEPEWADAEQLDELTRIQIDQARADLWATVSAVRDRVILEKMELFTPEELDAFLADAELRDQEAADRLADQQAVLTGGTESDLDDLGEF